MSIKQSMIGYTFLKAQDLGRLDLLLACSRLDEKLKFCLDMGLGDFSPARMTVDHCEIADDFCNEAIREWCRCCRTL